MKVPGLFKMIALPGRVPVMAPAYPVGEFPPFMVKAAPILSVPSSSITLPAVPDSPPIVLLYPLTFSMPVDKTTGELGEKESSIPACTVPAWMMAGPVSIGHGIYREHPRPDFCDASVSAEVSRKCRAGISCANREGASTLHNNRAGAVTPAMGAVKLLKFSIAVAPTLITELEKNRRSRQQECRINNVCRSAVSIRRARRGHGSGSFITRSPLPMTLLQSCRLREWCHCQSLKCSLIGTDIEDLSLNKTV